MIRAWIQRRRDDDDLTVFRTVAELGPTPGDAVRERLGLRRGRVWRALARLEDRGAVTARWEQPIPAGRQPRRVYAVQQYPDATQGGTW